MNWLTRIFSRRKDDDLPDYREEVVSEISVAALPEPGQIRPSFASEATALDRMTIRGGHARIRHNMSQAFTPSQPVSSINRFAGRAALLSRVIRAIEDQQLHVVIYGDRGIGKTSLMRVVSELARRARYVVHFTSCGEQSEFSETFRAVASQIQLLYDGKVAPGTDDVERGGTLADRLPTGDFTVSQLTAVFEAISGTRVLILLDEFDRAESPRFRASVAELIKNLSDRSIRVQIIIAGVASNLTELIAHIPSIRRNIIGISLPNLGVDEIRDMVSIAQQHGSPNFSNSAIAELAEASGGLPYLAALIGQHAVIAGAEDGVEQIEIEHVVLATGRAAEDILSRLSPNVSHALQDMTLFPPGSLIADSAADAIRHDGMICDIKIIDRLAGAGALVRPLVAPIEGDVLGRWHFVEDGASSYIWLTTGMRHRTGSEAANQG